MRNGTVAVAPRLVAVQRHFRGLKRRLLWVFISLGIGSSLTWYYRKMVFTWLLLPAHGKLSATGNPVFTNPTDMLSITLHISVIGGFIAATPVAVFQTARFISPLLNKQQRRFIALFMPVGFIFYAFGMAFAYFVLLPTGLRFLLSFSTDIATPMIRITDYMDLVLAMLFWMGIVFELPLVMYLLARLGIVSRQRFKRFRRYVPAAAFILAAIITPTFDWINQSLVALPLIALYELGIVLAWLGRPKRK